MNDGSQAIKQKGELRAGHVGGAVVAAAVSTKRPSGKDGCWAAGAWVPRGHAAGRAGARAPRDNAAGRKGQGHTSTGTGGTSQSQGALSQKPSLLPPLLAPLALWPSMSAVLSEACLTSECSTAHSSLSTAPESELVVDRADKVLGHRHCLLESLLRLGTKHQPVQCIRAEDARSSGGLDVLEVPAAVPEKARPQAEGTGVLA